MFNKKKVKKNNISSSITGLIKDRVKFPIIMRYEVIRLGPNLLRREERLILTMIIHQLMSSQRISI